LAEASERARRPALRARGQVATWKPTLDPLTQAPKGFGFVEFEDAEGVLRALRLLNGVKLDGQELLLKVWGKEWPWVHARGGR
jgi:RNA-binding protein 25